VKAFRGELPARAFLGSAPLLRNGRFEMTGIAVRKPDRGSSFLFLSGDHKLRSPQQGALDLGIRKRANRLLSGLRIASGAGGCRFQRTVSACSISMICGWVTPLKARSCKIVSILSRSSVVHRSSAWITAMVALPSRKSLALACLEHLRMRSSRAHRPRFETPCPGRDRYCPNAFSCASVAPPKIAPNRMHTENRQAVLR